MAKKPNLKTITSGYAATTALNDNFEALRDALDNTVSRDGSVPNAMTADFDMNGNDILNAGRILVDGQDYLALSLEHLTAAQAAQAAAELAESNSETIEENVLSQANTATLAANDAEQAYQDIVNHTFTTTSLSDVDNTARSDGSVLVYNGTTSKYVATNSIENDNTVIKGGNY